MTRPATTVGEPVLREDAGPGGRRAARRTSGLPRLLGGLSPEGGALSLAEHEQRHGALPPLAHREVLELIEHSDLRGRGGAGFPVAAKVRAVLRGRRRPVVVANGAGSDPLSEKDAFLLTRVPHLVLDGAQVAAAAVGAARVHGYLAPSPDVRDAMEHALAERRRRSIDRVAITLTDAPSGYVAGEASAVVHHLSGGPALPTFRPPRMAERGVRGRPTLVLNVETLANLGLLARHGVDWFRAVGTDDEPGSLVVTVHGRGPTPAVVEVGLGATVESALLAAGGWAEPVAAVLVGGTSGRWLPGDLALRAPLSHDGLRGVGAVLGTGALLVLSDVDCGLTETAGLARYLARGSAGQCGPCTNGLPAIASTLSRLAEADADAVAVQRLHRWCATVPGRGACRHPDDTAGLVASALDVFAADVEAHLDGTCLQRGARGER